ncbi:MAG: virion morphogenesis protein, partial [Jannaschia sp.]
LARLSAEDAARIGSTQRVAVLSADTARKQAVRHPEITPSEYLAAQRVVDQAQHRIDQGANRLIYIREEGTAETGYVLVVKAVLEDGELFIVSFYRLSRDEAQRDREIRRLLKKG